MNRPALSIREVPPLDRSVALGMAERPGAAVLEGWSDEAGWRTVLPWPEQIVELPWTRAHAWRSVVDSVASEAPSHPSRGVRRPASAFSSGTTKGGSEPPHSVAPEAPFLGGWVGHLAYDAGALHEAATLYDEMPPEPPVWLARHSSGIVRRPDGTHFLFAPDEAIDERERALRSLRDSLADARLVRSAMRRAVEDSLGGGAYARAVETIRESIARGDVYQVNLTRRFRARPHEHLDAVRLYLAMTGDEPPRCSAFVRGSGWTIASASPEVFLRFNRAAGVAESRPIKGTIARAGDDAREIAALHASVKDESEHLMIVDLVRNDLGRVAPPGHVTVPAFKAVRTLRYVHHLESTVRADGLQRRTLGDLLDALFPAGSITGAPKRAAVHAIRELEPVPRGVYTGAIGFIDDRGTAELSVAIRTAVVARDHVRYHAGGGIVWDSVAEQEDAECRAKSVAFLEYVSGAPQ